MSKSNPTPEAVLAAYRASFRKLWPDVTDHELEDSLKLDTGQGWCADNNRAMFWICFENDDLVDAKLGYYSDDGLTNCIKLDTQVKRDHGYDCMTEWYNGALAVVYLN